MTEGGRPIALIGFMGAGKTAVGEALAARLGYRFVDVDRLAEARAGKTVAEIFAAHGEAHFRGLEKALVREWAGREGVVLAPGGGAVLDAESRALLLSSCRVVWLRVSGAEVLRRLRPGGRVERPLLEGGPPHEGVSQLLREREEFYALAPLQVDTERKSVEQVVEEVLRLLAAAPGGEAPPGPHPAAG